MNLFGKSIGGHSADQSPRVSGISDDALTPVPDEVAGPVFAYRGTEQHGVPVHAGSSGPEDAHGRYVDAVIVPEEHEPHPIAVRVVREEANEFVDWRVIATSVDASPRVVIPRQRTRTACRLLNAGTQTVYISGSGGIDITVVNGFPIAAGTYIDTKTTEEIYAVSADGSVQPIRALVEFANG